MAKKSDRRALGRGLSALLGDADAATAVAPAPATNAPKGGTEDVPIDLIEANPDQPRRVFRDMELDELAKSLKAHGFLQPVLLRPHPGDPKKYQIIAGERRWRAAQRAGIHAVPSVIRPVNDREVLEFAIVENVQRVDLDPIEEARGYTQLVENYGYTQEELSEVIGKSRSQLANSMRLLSLPYDVIALVQAGKLSAGHARALIKAEDPVALAQEAVNQGLSVRQVEALVKEPKRSEPGRKAHKPAGKDADTKLLEGDLSAAIGMRVAIQANAQDGSGEVRIRYKSLEQLDDLCRKLSE
ncbi:MAG: ParB/RepB/Spo0J family partition protein [Pseudomonadota bacterium]